MKWLSRLGALLVGALIGSALVWMVGCASLRTTSGAVNVPLILTDAQFGVNAACSQQWLSPDVCVFATDALTTAQSIAAKDPANAKAAVRQDLIDVLAKIPTDAKVRPYLAFIIPLLG